MFGFFANLKLYAILAVVIGGVGYYAYYKYQKMEADLATAEQNAIQLEAAIATQESTIQALNQNIVKMQAAIAKLSSDFQDARDKVNDLETTLTQNAAGNDRDIGKLAAAKPGLVEKIVNTGTDDTMRCFELLSGALPTEAEKNDKTFSSCIPSNNPDSM